MLKIGHRGAAGYEPENTLRSFRKALKLGVDMIEFDVRRCKTGELVVIHDETVGRTTNGTGRVADMSFEELRKLDAGKGEKIPTPEEVLDLIDKKVAVNIELKAKNTAGPVAKLVRDYITEKGWKPKQFLITSFNRQEFDNACTINPGYRLGILVRKSPFGIVARARHYNVYSVHIHQKFLKKWLVRWVQKFGFKVFAFWLSNEKWEKKARKMGVDGIIADYPDRL